MHPRLQTTMTFWLFLPPFRFQIEIKQHKPREEVEFVVNLSKGGKPKATLPPTGSPIK
jgi:hypothetical protein